jgi:hypothetical protein
MPQTSLKSRYVKVRTLKSCSDGAKTIYLRVIRESAVGIMGRPVNHETLEDQSHMKGGKLVDVQQFIQRSAIKWTQEMEEDRKYGNLVPAGEKKIINTEKNP